MGQLDALGRHVSRIEQKLQPVNNDRAEARAILSFCTDVELAQMAAVYEAAATKLGVTAIDILSPDLMTEAEIALFQRIEENALARKAAGQLPYSVLQRC